MVTMASVPATWASIFGVTLRVRNQLSTRSRAIPLLHRIAGVSLELEPLDSELNGAVVAVEQRHVEFDLELSYVARQCGRADAGASAGLAKMEGFAEHDEVFERGVVHGGDGGIGGELEGNSRGARRGRGVLH